MTFVETFAPYVLHGLQWEDKHRSVQRMFERQWGHLREAVLFCVRHHDSQHTPAAQKQARRHFTEYALAVQEVWYPLPPLEQAHIAMPHYNTVRHACWRQPQSLFQILYPGRYVNSVMCRPLTDWL